MKNYYQILGLEADATQEEIEGAYKLYTAKFDPDKHQGDRFFEEKFKEIQEAYEILSRSKKKDSSLKQSHESSAVDSSSSSNNTDGGADVIQYENSSCTITTTYYLNRKSWQKYPINEIKEVVYKRSFLPINVVSGIFVIALAVFVQAEYELLNLFEMTLLILGGVFSCMSRGSKLYIVDSNNNRIKVSSSTSNKCYNAFTTLHFLVKEDKTNIQYNGKTCNITNEQIECKTTGETYAISEIKDVTYKTTPHIIATLSNLAFFLIIITVIITAFSYNITHSNVGIFFSASFVFIVLSMFFKEKRTIYILNKDLIKIKLPLAYSDCPKAAAILTYLVKK